MKRKRLIQGIATVLVVVLVAGMFLEVKKEKEMLENLPHRENPIFEIDLDDVNSIIIQCSDTAERIEIRDTERIEEICGLLNAFEYERYEPAPDADGWSTGITVHCVSTRVSCAFGSEHISVDGIWYYGPEDYFKPLRDIFAQDSPERQNGEIKPI